MTTTTRTIPTPRDGTVVSITGKIEADAKRIQVNLRCGADVALHVNPRYDDGLDVVRNTYTSGSWGVEERSGDKFSLKPGQSITVLLVCGPSSFKISFNDIHHYEYKYRLPLEKINQLSLFSIIGETVIMTSQPGASFPIPVSQAKTAVHECIPAGLAVGKKIFITATPGTTRMQFDFMVGSDVAFHFNPRPEENVVVRNTRISGTWGTEERAEPFFPFKNGIPSFTVVECLADRFKVTVDESYSIEYKYRMKLESITSVCVFGNASDAHVYVQ